MGVQTEKLNIEREVKQLRQSTALLNKRESIVDKRRESVACGLNKTKLQLSSTEHALQMKTNELEKTAFDLQLLQVCTFLGCNNVTHQMINLAILTLLDTYEYEINSLKSPHTACVDPFSE
jgi:hypothetical protein